MTAISQGGHIMGVKVREKVRGSGVYWVFINHRGQRKSKLIGDEETANEVAEKIKAKITLGDFKIESNNAKPTFQKVSEKWIGSFNQWKNSTRENYQNSLNTHVLPAIGKLEIDRISRKVIRRFIDSKIKKYSPEYVKLMKVVISGTMQYAADEGYVDSDPTAGISMKKKRGSDRVKPLSESDAVAVLGEAQKFMGGFYYPVLLFLIRTGVRIGEAQALRWPKIDLKERTAYIDKAFRSGKISTPKSHQRRIVDMTPHLTNTLSKLKKTDFVFEGVGGGMMHRETLRNALNRCVENAKLEPIRIHDLRHTYATIRLMRGHNPWDVSKQLGHSSIKITYDTYGHWIPSQFKSEVDDLDRI